MGKKTIIFILRAVFKYAQNSLWAASEKVQNIF